MKWYFSIKLSIFHGLIGFLANLIFFTYQPWILCGLPIWEFNCWFGTIWIIMILSTYVPLSISNRLFKIFVLFEEWTVTFIFYLLILLNTLSNILSILSLSYLNIIFFHSFFILSLYEIKEERESIDKIFSYWNFLMKKKEKKKNSIANLQ